MLRLCSYCSSELQNAKGGCYDDGDGDSSGNAHNNHNDSGSDGDDDDDYIDDADWTGSRVLK